MGTKKVSTPTIYQAEVKEDPNTKELYFNLPSGLLESLGWTEEDELEWYKTHEGNNILEVTITRYIVCNEILTLISRLRKLANIYSRSVIRGNIL